MLLAGSTVRLAYVTETFPPEINGVALTAERFVSGLRARGHAIDLVRPRQPHESSLGQRVASCDRRCADSDVSRSPFGLPHISQAGQALATTLVLIWFTSRPKVRLGWAAIRAARANGIPVTSDFRTNFDLYSEHYGFGWLRGVVGGYLKHFHNATDRTFVPTSAVSSALTQAGLSAHRSRGSRRRC